MSSEPVEFDRGLGDALFGQEVRYLEPLIALELNDLAEFFVVDKSTVACKIPFESFQQLLQIILFRQTLQSSQGLATVALLDADVDVILLRSDVGILEIAFLGERVEALEVLKTHAMESGSRGCV